MSYTQQDLRDISAAIATGVLQVTINGRSTTFRSLAEMMQVRSMIEDAVNGAGSTGEDRVLKTSYKRDYQ
ncbi:hypothetical protein HBA55_34900 [Pseudomaricurvus alkylphenolicus]|uniref:phage head-tail joining protein n=1 Tax=Pseudomaricurvus alkylphenolicus TaxID=1306991 RepID=UPI00141E1CB0|nr:hypothetical protein [Pseudomaricurvus alkylphenolicus]NIB44822.1 hypothetical protein [Pseudomaricurvus alkylphenolicus]